jgi:hypothetical protein
MCVCYTYYYRVDSNFAMVEIANYHNSEEPRPIKTAK